MKQRKNNKETKEEKTIIKPANFIKEKKILLWLWLSFFSVAALFWLYNLYFQYHIVESAQKAVLKNPVESNEIKNIFELLKSRHFFSNIIVSEKSPSEKNLSDLYIDAINTMKTGNELSNNQVQFFKIKLSYWIKAVEESKIKGEGKFIEQDLIFLKTLIDVNKTALHNGFMWSAQLSLISIILFITWLLSLVIWKEKSMKAEEMKAKE